MSSPPYLCIPDFYWFPKWNKLCSSWFFYYKEVSLLTCLPLILLLRKRHLLSILFSTFVANWRNQVDPTFLVCVMYTHVLKSPSYPYFKGRLTGYVVTGLLFAVNGKPYFEDQEPVQGFVMNFSNGEIIDVFKPVRKVFTYINYVSVFMRIKLKYESWNSIYIWISF